MQMCRFLRRFIGRGSCLSILNDNEVSISAVAYKTSCYLHVTIVELRRRVANWIAWRFEFGFLPPSRCQGGRRQLRNRSSWIVKMSKWTRPTQKPTKSEINQMYQLRAASRQANRPRTTALLAFLYFWGGFPSAFHSATFVNLRSLIILDRKQSVYIFQQHVNTTRTIQVISINVGLAAGPPNVAAVTDVTCICRACPTVSQGWKTNWIDDYR